MSEKKPLILIIEDEAQMRHFLRASLTNHGYDLIEAEAGQEGLTLAAAHTPDLILLDLGLADLDGLVVTQRLRE
ncbi:MAG TPA: response regulator, partial [Polyangiaceae bacterium]|nr:response regulator [Polyangiaceae bacterium]